MRVLVCGSRHFNDYKLLKETLDGINITTIIHGAARGADTLSGMYGEANDKEIVRYPALWGLYGKRAGPIRNGQMLREGKPDLVIAFLAPNSRGTQNMIDQATKANIPVKVINV